MIGSLTGIASSIYRNPIIIDVHGVGYRTYVTERLLHRLVPKKTITLLTYTYVRDDSLDLYGFETQEDLLLFELLLTVSGIGPKTALTVMNLGVDSIRRAIVSADVNFFTTVPRLGKKNAQKIIIELKTKLGSIDDIDLTQEEQGDTKQILDALQTMGFTKSEALIAIRELDPKIATIEQKIRTALKSLGTKQQGL